MEKLTSKTETETISIEDLKLIIAHLYYEFECHLESGKTVLECYKEAQYYVDYRFYYSKRFKDMVQKCTTKVAE